jgi:hypothetical protein
MASQAGISASQTTRDNIKTTANTLKIKYNVVLLHTYLKKVTDIEANYAFFPLCKFADVNLKQN